MIPMLKTLLIVLPTRHPPVLPVILNAHPPSLTLEKECLDMTGWTTTLRVATHVSILLKRVVTLVGTSIVPPPMRLQAPVLLVATTNAPGTPWNDRQVPMLLL